MCVCVRVHVCDVCGVCMYACVITCVMYVHVSDARALCLCACVWHVPMCMSVVCVCVHVCDHMCYACARV